MMLLTHENQKKKKKPNELICKTETLAYLEKEHRATKGKGLVLEDRLGVWNWPVHTTVFNIDNQQGPVV